MCLNWPYPGKCQTSLRAWFKQGSQCIWGLSCTYPISVAVWRNYNIKMGYSTLGIYPNCLKCKSPKGTRFLCPWMCKTGILAVRREIRCLPVHCYILGLVILPSTKIYILFLLMIIGSPSCIIFLLAEDHCRRTFGNRRSCGLGLLVPPGTCWQVHKTPSSLKLNITINTTLPNYQLKFLCKHKIILATLTNKLAEYTYV